MKTPKTVLVIEDHPLVLEAISLLLEAEDLRVVGAPNGAAGKRLIRKAPPDLIVCDYQLPGMNGLELLSDLRLDQRTRRIPFVLITALQEPDLRERCLRKGCQMLLDKNSIYAELPAVVHEMLSPEAANTDPEAAPSRTRTT